MMTILRSRNFWVVAVFSAIFWAVAPWVPRSYLFDVVNAFSIAGCIGVIIMYYPSVAKKLGSWLWVFHNNLAGVHYFIIGVMGLFGYVIVRHSYNVIWRWMGKPDYMIDHLIVAFMVWGTFMIAVMNLLSRDMEEGQIPRENWRWVGIFVAVAIAMTGLFITFFDPYPGIVAGPFTR